MIAVDLSGKTAVVTGASQGLGEATARLLHQAGASVAINYVAMADNRTKAERVASDLGARAVALEADVRQPEAVETLLDRTLEQFGALDIVVNNAAILRDRTVKKMSREECRDVIDTDLTGVFNVCQAAVPRMSDGGRIVSFASISAAVGFFGQANYAAAKSGVIGLTKVLSKELGRRRITVNAVAPGVVLTEMGKTIPEETRAQMLTQIPLGRFAEPDEIARVVLFLCSDLADYVTGQTIHINGGWWG